MNLGKGGGNSAHDSYCFISLEQEFELHWSTSLWSFFQNSAVLYIYFLFLVIFLLTFFLAHFIVRIEY